MSTEYRVLKYRWDNNVEPVLMHKGARILSIQLQPGHLKSEAQIWAIADFDAPLVKRKISAWGTGFELPSGDPGKYLGTLQFNNGTFILHFFDLGEEKQTV